MVQYCVSVRGRCASRNVPVDVVREIRYNDCLSERGQSPTAFAEGELSAEEQEILRDTPAVL